MKKTLSILCLIFLISCSTPGRVCGGGRKRCVEVSTISSPEKTSKKIFV